MKVRSMIIIFFSTLSMMMLTQTNSAAGGIIEGYVLGSDNKTPIAGVSIVASSTANGDRIGSVRSSSDGRFIFTDIPGGTYDLDVFAEGYNFSGKSNISVKSDKITSDVNFMLFESASISGKVTEPDKLTPIHEAKIIMSDAEGMPEASTVTDNGGKYKIEELFPGIYGLSAEKEGYAFNFKGPIRIGEGQKINDINFILEKGAVISGKVLEKNNGNPIEGAIIALINSNGKIVGFYESDSDGYYLIKDLPADKYIFVIRTRNHVPLSDELSISTSQKVTDANFYLELSK